MACRTETTNINGIEYTCTQYPAKVAAKYKLKVIATFGSSLRKLLPALPSGNKKEQESDQVGILIDAITELFNSASPDEVIDLIWGMLSTGSVCRDGTRLNESLIDQHFSGDELADVYKVFIFVLRVNYAGFFKGQRAQEALAAAEKHL